MLNLIINFPMTSPTRTGVNHDGALPSRLGPIPSTTVYLDRHAALDAGDCSPATASPERELARRYG